MRGRYVVSLNNKRSNNFSYDETFNNLTIEFLS